MYVVNDFTTTINIHISRDRVLQGDVTAKDNNLYRTETFYKTNSNQTQERYDSLLRKWNYHCELVLDLCLELTRALNYIFDIVRTVLLPVFRIKEGVLLINNSSIFSSEILRPEYRPEELDILYPGLKQFMAIRKKRNCRFGTGISEEYIKESILF